MDNDDEEGLMDEDNQENDVFGSFSSSIVLFSIF